MQSDEVSVEKASLICQSIHLSVKLMKDVLAEIEESLKCNKETSESSLLYLNILKLVISTSREEILTSTLDSEKAIFLTTEEVANQILNKYVLVYKQTYLKKELEGVKESACNSQKCFSESAASEMYSSELEI